VLIQFRQKATYYGKVGVLVTTLSLVTRQELEKEFNQLGRKFESASEPVSEIISRGETHITLTSRFSNEVFSIPIEELIQEYKQQKLEELFIFIQNRFQPDPNETPLYPSDMVDEYRHLGLPEAQIQELLLKEKKTREI
jgi:hypothetical protein